MSLLIPSSLHQSPSTRPVTWRSAVPPQPAASVPLRDGTVVRLRPQRREDRPLIAEFFDSLSERSRFLRFMSPVRRLSPALLDRLCDVDGDHHFAWLALVGDEVVGVGRFVRSEHPRLAEIALTVADQHQRRGLGRLLLEALAIVAADRGITGFEHSSLAENRAVLALLRSSGARFDFGHGIVTGRICVTNLTSGRLPASELLDAAGPSAGASPRKLVTGYNS